MNKGAESVTTIVLGVLTVAAMCFFIYGSYWVAKNLSYAFFYEDMVKQTVVEMVGEQCLNK